MEVKDIKLSIINLSEFNTRKDLDAGTEDSGIDDLANSIKEKGLLNPIIVKQNKDGTYSLIAGQRRFLACKKLGLETIPAIIRDFEDDTDATIISLIENVLRADMNPIDKARAYQRILEKYKDLDRVAKETGVSITTIRKYIKLLSLSPSLQEKLSTTEGPAGIGTLSKLADIFAIDEQEEVLERIRGFAQPIQLEMIKRSGGDIFKLDELRKQALEGAFDTHLCTGLDDCPFIPDELINTVKQAIRKIDEEENTGSFKDTGKK
jgi:ParB family chromosome partitioning protein